MLFALLLAATPCVDPGFCPTRADLERAIEDDRQRLEGTINHIEGEAHPDSPGVIALDRPQRITALSCGKPFELPPRTLECRFTLHYPDHRETRTATLAKTAKAWRIVQTRSAIRH